MPVRKLRVVLADDHVVLREGLALLISAQPDMEIVGQAGDGRTAVQQIQESQPDLVVMDISMPGMSGIQAITHLRKNYPQTQIVMLTRHNEPGYVRQVLQSGARGYVLKQAGAEELIEAIRIVASGGTYLDRTLTHRVVYQFVQAHNQARASDLQETHLSEREANVVRLTAYGYSNKEIATQLGISIKTVDTYKSRAMEKLGLHSRAALVRYALHQGWLDNS